MSCIPIRTINLLQALPKTPLWERLARADRITDDPSLESNVRFLRPYDEVVGLWRRAIARAYDPERLFARFIGQVEKTYVHRISPPARGRLTWANVRFGAIFALSGTVGPILGQNFGAGSFTRVRDVLTHSLLVTAAFTGLAWVILFVLAWPLTDAFDVHGETADLIVFYCRALSPVFVFLGAVLLGAF